MIIIKGQFRGCHCVNRWLRYGLPMSNCCWHGTLVQPHSSRSFTRVLATTTKICNTGGSSQTHVRPSTLTGTPSYSSKHWDLWFWLCHTEAIAALTAVHRERALVPSIFRVTRFGRMSCYTLLSGCQLPWPPSCCLQPVTPFQWYQEIAVI